ncbi:COG3014 family protein [Celerinatantimonas diazotrophica]|nr:hypothetical protein [Celerinatantimonas diazotrophica]
MCRIVAAVILLLNVVGCSSLSGRDLIETYSSQMSNMRHSVKSGDIKQAIDDIDPGSPHNTSYYLRQLELGRLEQLAGNYQSSEHHFKIVEDYLNWLSNQAQYRLSHGIQNSVDMLTNDSARSYRIPVFEQVMLHQYQAVNYLHQNNLTGALVEVRKGELLQQKALNNHPDEQNTVEQRYQSQVQSVMSQYPSMSNLISQSMSQYQNSYTYLFSSALYLAANQPDDAYIDLKRALKVAPDNTAIGKLTRYLATQLVMPDADELKARYPKFDLNNSKGMVWVFVEQNLIPYRREFAVRLPVPINHQLQYWSVAFPVLPDSIKPSRSVKIHADGQVLPAQVSTQLQSLAGHALKDELPGMIVRQLLRLTSKSVLADQMDRQNRWLGLLTNLYNAVSEHADTRSWETLPATVRFAVGAFAPGTVNLKFSPLGQTVAVPVKKQAITLVIVSSIGQIWKAQVFTL